jgi:hypothetical protein
MERYQHGFVEAIGRLYVFGGITRTSGSIDNRTFKARLLLPEYYNRIMT